MSRRATLRASLVGTGLAAAVLTGLACGGPGLNGEQETAVAKRAAEPRVSDPTGARPLDTNAVLYGRPAASATVPTALPTASTDDAGPPKRIGARHVLIQWMGSERAPSNVVRTRDQALATAQQVLARAKAGDDFARLAVEYSDEPGASARGGSLGRFGRGAMVPAFEEAVFKLQVGEISGIVETGFGFHVIQRTE